MEQKFGKIRSKKTTKNMNESKKNQYKKNKKKKKDILTKLSLDIKVNILILI